MGIMFELIGAIIILFLLRISSTGSSGEQIIIIFLVLICWRLDGIKYSQMEKVKKGGGE